MRFKLARELSKKHHHFKPLSCPCLKEKRLASLPSTETSRGAVAIKECVTRSLQAALARPWSLPAALPKAQQNSKEDDPSPMDTEGQLSYLNIPSNCGGISTKLVQKLDHDSTDQCLPLQVSMAGVSEQHEITSGSFIKSDRRRHQGATKLSDLSLST